MGEIEQLERMIEQLEAMRDTCEHKTNDNARYQGFSAAINGLNQVIADFRRQEES